MSPIVSSSPPAPAKSPQRRILVCLDRSAYSEACVPHALMLARAFHSALTLVHVMQPQHNPSGQQTCDALGWEISSQEARNYLERIERQVVQTLWQDVDTRLEQGRPAARIVDLARELDAEVTVLGSRGEGGTRDQSLGSTVQQVLASSRGSVLIVHPAKTDRSPAGPKQILVPLDGSLRTESVLPAAARLAGAHGAELLLVHIVQEPVPSALLASPEDIELARTLAGRLEASARRYLERLRLRLSHEVSVVRTLVVRHANERQCLVEISQKEQIALIVLSAHGSACDSGRTFGSVAAYLLTHSTVPLLVLQDLPGELQPIQDLDAPLAPPPLRASYASGRA